MIEATFMHYPEGRQVTTPAFSSLQMRYGEIVGSVGEVVATQNDEGLWVYDGAVYTDVVFGVAQANVRFDPPVYFAAKLNRRTGLTRVFSLNPHTAPGLAAAAAKERVHSASADHTFIVVDHTGSQVGNTSYSGKANW